VNIKQSQELRTWLLFVTGIILLVVFAWRKDPLGPYWTMILGAMLGMTVLVSAVQGGAGTNTGRKTRGKDNDDGSLDAEQPEARGGSTAVGDRGSGPLLRFGLGHAGADRQTTA
jgi:hypothetical protein